MTGNEILREVARHNGFKIFEEIFALMSIHKDVEIKDGELVAISEDGCVIRCLLDPEFVNLVSIREISVIVKDPDKRELAYFLRTLVVKGIDGCELFKDDLVRFDSVGELNTALGELEKHNTQFAAVGQPNTLFMSCKFKDAKSVINSSLSRYIDFNYVRSIKTN
jgi:hypothetical protein